MFVTESFSLSPAYKQALHEKKPSFGFNGFGEAIYRRTYSRIKPDGAQESWADTVVRVVEGVMAIRKTHYRSHGLRWRDDEWQTDAQSMADAMFDMHFLPPGRGLWTMGTPYIAERGAAALYNCAATAITCLSDDSAFLMDLSMCGVGVGFSTIPTRKQVFAYEPLFSRPGDPDHTYVIPDTREGWVESVRRLIAAYEAGGIVPTFDYSAIRAAGEPIKGFGGTSEGPEPLRKLHLRIMDICDHYRLGLMSETQLITDTMNAIGACVVAGNVRRSAEIALGSVHDDVFLNLKNPRMYPDRQDIAWLSNNSVVLRDHEDFLKLPTIADRIRENGEPGIFNLVNIQKFGRLFREMEDAATLTNPCGEIALEDKEVCNLVEVFPTRCKTRTELDTALYLATLYASTVSLLPTHRDETNAVVGRNRRIGVSLSGIADWTEGTSVAAVTRILRDGYRDVREANKQLARAAGVPESIRVTTVKPSGTISLLAGVSSGMHWPLFRYAIRRVRAGESSPFSKQMIEQGVPWEHDAVSDSTLVFSFPIDQSHTRPVEEVSVWEQASRVAMLQREWADNMVSNTISFNPDTEGRDIERVLAEFAPITKTMSMLPHTPQGAYEQMPYEGIDEGTYNELASKMPALHWEGFAGSDGEDDRYCSGDSCFIRFGGGATLSTHSAASEAT